MAALVVIGVMIAALLLLCYLVDRRDRRRRGWTAASSDILRTSREANRDARATADMPMMSGDVSWTAAHRRNRQR
jgi:hypothetical protein